mgnify:CR=1 FL=1|jgi:hypothetical protein
MTEDKNGTAVLPDVEAVYKKLRDDLLTGVPVASEDELVEIKTCLRSVALDPTDRERIIKAVQLRHDDLLDIKVPLAALRKEMSGPSRVVRMGGPVTRPKWCEPWVWVANHNKFYNLDANNFFSPQTFDMLHGADVPEVSGTRARAVAYVSQHGFVPTVLTPVYMPTSLDKLLWVDGDYCVNTFTHGTLPVAAEDYTDAGNLYLDSIEAHMRMLCGTAEDAAILLQWLAHQVQHPGVKILWSPLIQSVEGIGKSFFSRLLRCGLGVRNVGVVNPAQLVSNFNEWANGVCVNVLEELKIAGHNRHEALNAVKPLITDDFIQVNPKGVNAYMTPNTANYIAFTNSADALPLGGADRRWWVIQCPLRHYTEVPDYKNYFPALFEGLKLHEDEVCAWLNDYEISGEFLNMKQAPMTTAKAFMVATEEASFDGHAEVKSVIEDGGYLFDEECLSSAALFRKVRVEYPELDLQTNRRALVLKRLGFQAMAARTIIDGVKQMFWVKRPMTVEEIRAKWPEKPTL